MTNSVREVWWYCYHCKGNEWFYQYSKHWYCRGCGCQH